MITFKKGNLMASGAEALLNTVNTAGVMGKGIALQFKNRFPYNYGLYHRACQRGELQVGKLLVVRDYNLLMGERLIINFPTKTHWRLPSEYRYIEQGLVSLKMLLQTNPVRTLAIPALGCGNGGLDWHIVKPMILRELSALDMEIVVYEPETH